jgi:hypothetical protein
MTADPISSNLPTLPGFDKECKALIYAMVEAGWTGRITSKRHWFGKAPDSKTTITVPSKMGQNRGLANAEAQFMRWLKNQMGTLPNGTPIIETHQTGNPVLDPIVREGFVKHAVNKLPKPLVIDVVKREPWLARRNAKRGGGIRYESEAVIQRTWNNGDIDFECAFEGCDYASDKPRSVANHYGAAHTQKGEAEPAQNGPLHVDPEYTEPASTRTYRPTQRLVEALMHVIDTDEFAGMDASEQAALILSWFHDRPDIEHESRPLVPLTDADILNRIRVLVGTPDPDQTEQIESLTGELIEARRQRDEANAHLVKVQRDLDGIKELMEGVGR